MSQEKVDRYKKEKANRKNILKKQKQKIVLAKVASSVVALIIVGWIGHSAYVSITDHSDEYVDVNLDALYSYTGSLTSTSSDDTEDVEATTDVDAETEETVEETAE